MSRSEMRQFAQLFRVYQRFGDVEWRLEIEVTKLFKRSQLRELILELPFSTEGIVIQPRPVAQLWVVSKDLVQVMNRKSSYSSS